MFERSNAASPSPQRILRTVERWKSPVRVWSLQHDFNRVGSFVLFRLEYRIHFFHSQAEGKNCRGPLTCLPPTNPILEFGSRLTRQIGERVYSCSICVSFWGVPESHETHVSLHIRFLSFFRTGKSLLQLSTTILMSFEQLCQVHLREINCKLWRPKASLCGRY